MLWEVHIVILVKIQSGFCWLNLKCPKCQFYINILLNVKEKKEESKNTCIHVVDIYSSLPILWQEHLVKSLSFTDGMYVSSVT